MSSLWQRSATELAALTAVGEVSAREVVVAHLERIDERNGEINAIVARRPDAAVLADADRLDNSNEPRGALHGLPIAIKDLADVAGLPTRSGSVITSSSPETTDSLFVTRLRRAGAVIVGKTNTPEFGAGSHTFNEVYGVTRNPADLSRTAGGSSGGGAAALAAGMISLADGSDLGGSLRNPPAFCGVVGFRPSIGRVPSIPDRSSWLNSLVTLGPMGRSVADVALMLSVMAGPDDRDPLSLSDPGSTFNRPGHPDLDQIRLAWAGDLGLPVDSEVIAQCRAAVAHIGDEGADVVEVAPDLTGAMDAFRTFRALHYRDFALQYPEDEWRRCKPALVGNIEAGLALTIEDLWRAEHTRTRLHLEMVRFFQDHAVLALPTTQVLPFPVETEWPTRINDVDMIDYIDWMSICCVITMTGCPAISIPAGRSASGLPIGLQLVGPPRGDRQILAIAQSFEAASSTTP